MTPIAFSTLSLLDNSAVFGTPDSRHTLSFENLPQLKQLLTEDSHIIPADLEDFRRASQIVRLAQLAALLCASACPDWSPDGTAIIGVNGSGCAHNNRVFWDDFVSHQRDSARASLFVPTLPSIPICEAAISLAIHGPARFILTSSEEQTTEMLQDMLDTDPELTQILLLEVTQQTATATLFQR